MAKQLTTSGAEPPGTARNQRIPKRVRHAVDLLLSGKVATQKAAAEQAGISPEHLSRSLRKDQVQQYMASATRRTIIQAQAAAAGTLTNLLEAGSEHVRLEASKLLLSLNGIRPPDREGVQVNVNVTPGYIIDLSDGATVLDGNAVRVDTGPVSPADPPDVVAERSPTGDGSS